MNPVIEAAQKSTSHVILRTQLSIIEAKYTLGDITQGIRDAKKKEIEAKLNA